MQNRYRTDYFGRETDSDDYYRQATDEQAVRALLRGLCSWPSCGSTDDVAPLYVPRAAAALTEVPCLCDECRERATITITSSLNSDGGEDASTEVRA